MWFNWAFESHSSSLWNGSSKVTCFSRKLVSTLITQGKFLRKFIPHHIFLIVFWLLRNCFSLKSGNYLGTTTVCFFLKKRILPKALNYVNWVSNSLRKALKLENSNWFFFRQKLNFENFPCLCCVVEEKTTNEDFTLVLFFQLNYYSFHWYLTEKNQTFYIQITNTFMTSLYKV